MNRINLVNSTNKDLPAIDPEKQDDEALKQACKDFEAVFLSIMFKEMYKTIPEDGLTEKSNGTKIFEEMYIEELSEEVANGNESIGISDMMYQQFKNGYVSW